MFTYYFKIWLTMTSFSFQTAFVSRVSALLFTVAKSLRFLFFILIVVLIVGRTQTLAGYTLIQSLIFFLTFNIIDTGSQLLFRDVYRFRQKIISGDFDLTLMKPTNSLFMVLLGGADPLDLLMLIPYIGILGWLCTQISLTFGGFFVYMILMMNAFLIAAAFHIAVLALGVITTEIDHAIFIYRDVTSMARFPVDMYREPLRAFITFVIPVGVMITFPPKALFGLLNIQTIIFASGLGIFVLWLSITFWKHALTQYTSASS